MRGREDVEALHAQAPDAVGVVIGRREERIAELQRRLDRESSNSSMPPSKDPPKSRAERRRAAREAYKRSMRKSSGQPGHEGKTRELGAPERVDERVVHRPDCCAGCGRVFDGAEEGIGDPVVRQQFELPATGALVFEHERLRLRCPACERATLAGLPQAALSGYGPRLQAHIAMLAGVFRLSREQVRQVAVEVFGIPASVGAIEMRSCA